MALILAQQGPGGAEAVWAGGFFLVWLLVVGAAVVLFIWALVDAIRNPNLSDNERLVWILVIIFVGCIGPILYLAIGRNKGPRRPTTGATNL